MPIALPKLLTAKTTKTNLIFWFSLSLAFAVVYGVLCWRQAFAGEYVVQDDARQHVFWMQRFMEAGLFPEDLIANYFQSVAPFAYTGLYFLLAKAGVTPLLFSKILPAVLAVLTTVYCFALCLHIIPIPATAFVATLLFNQNFWMRDDLASASPRAFLNLLFLAFLFYLLRRSQMACWVAIGLLGGFYPQYVLVAAGVLFLRLWQWQDGRLRLCQNRDDRRLCWTGLVVVAIVMLPYVLTSSEFGPVITVAQAKALPEFLPGGRSRFFYDDFGKYWIWGGRSGIQPALDPPLFCVALLLPLLLRAPHRFPLVPQLRQGMALFGQMIVTGLGWFGLAHLLLFKLHLPSRYTQHNLRIVMALSAAIALTILLDALLRWVAQSDRPLRKFFANGLVLLTVALLALYPLSLNNFPKNTYVTGTAPTLYRYLAAQPKTTLVASLSAEAGNLPTFSGRSVLVSEEYAIPYHWGYYQQFRQRVLDLIEAQYSSDWAIVQHFIQKYGITHWLLNKQAFSAAAVAQDSWLKQYQPVTAQAVTRLQQGQIPALATLGDRCTVLQTEQLVLLNAECIASTLEKTSGRR
jgi:hypothetical protein